MKMMGLRGLLGVWAVRRSKEMAQRSGKVEDFGEGNHILIRRRFAQVFEAMS
jgi:hypothetical protein